MKEIIGILDSDYSFAEVLAERINEDGDFPYEARAFSDQTALFSVLEEGSLAALLLSADREDEEVLRKDIPKIGLLSDVRGFSSIHGLPAVFKYRPVSDLREEILRLVSADTKEDAAGLRKAGSRCSFIGVASPSGRVYKTSFALVLGMLLSQNARVLYVNLEPCSGFSTLFEKQFDRDLADVLYRYEAGDRDFCPEEMLEEYHGLKILPPAGLAEDVCHMDPKTVRQAITEAAERLRMDMTVVDLGPDLRFTESFFPMLSKLYIPLLPNTAQEGKEEMFQAFLNRLQDENDAYPAVSVEEVALPAVRTFARGRLYLEQLLWSELGDAVRQLLGGIV